MERSQQIRLGVLGMVVLSLFAAMFARLWYLQVITYEETVQEVETVQFRNVDLPGARGRILDVKGRVLVDNRPALVLTINKERFFAARPTAPERQEVYAEIARQLSARGELTKVAEISGIVEGPKYGPLEDVQLIRDVDQDLVTYFIERSYQYPGIGHDSIMVREYPYGTLAAHVLGYVGSISQEEIEANADTDKPYLANDEIGKAGVERTFEEHLRGTPGFRRYQVDSAGRIIREIETASVEPQAGSDIRLTIDIDIQAELERQIEAQVLATRARRCELDPKTGFCPPYTAPFAAGVIQNPQTGDVIAMASYPTYDPAEFVNGISQAKFEELTTPESNQPLNNRAILGFQPASTIKPFIAYAALEHGLMGDGDAPLGGIFFPYQDTGYWYTSTCPFPEGSEERERSCRKQNADAQAMGQITLPYAIAQSSDAYFYRIGESFHEDIDDDDDATTGDGQTALVATLNEFGLGIQTGIDLPFENTGLLNTPELRREAYRANPGAFDNDRWQPNDTIVSAIGQENIFVTPLQLANGYAALANGGTVYVPNLVTEVIDPLTDETEIAYAPEILNQLDYPAAWEEPIVDGLELATSYYLSESIRGTAAPIFVGNSFTTPQGPNMASWPVAGKTGTAEHTDEDGNPLAENSLFVGLGPMPNPQYVASLYFEESGFGGQAAAPTVARIFKAIAEGTIPPAQRVIDDQGDSVAVDDATLEVDVVEGGGR
jgi:penicillin-binding protein 2